MAVFLNKNSFCSIHMLTLFRTKTILRENRFFGAGWQLVDGKGTHNVKYYTKKRTKQGKKMERIWGLTKMKRAWKQIARKQNKVCHAAHLIIYGLDEPPMVDENYLAKATERVSRITVIFTCPG